jgi:ribose 5-phosphate isomerase B
MLAKSTRSMKALREVIIIGSDHQGFAMKEFIKRELTQRNIAVKDVGAFTADEPSDYPVYVSKVAGAVSSGAYRRGIAIDGSGVGTSVVCNRFPHVRAALCNDIAVARIARGHADSNVLVLAGRLTPEWLAAQILDAWLSTAFEGGRHERRVKLIDDNTQLAIAFDHLGEIDPTKIQPESVNQPFLQRAMKGLEKIVALLHSDERRVTADVRHPETCSATVNYEGRPYGGLLLDISERGAQLRLTGQVKIAPFVIDESLDFSVKTPYGASSCSGMIKWVDVQSRTIGVAFTAFPKDPNDPLRLLLDSMF